MELVELAQNYFGNTRSGSLAGPIGGFLIAALAIVTILLIRNMNARIRRLPDRFPDQESSDQRSSELGSHDQESPRPKSPGEYGEAGGSNRT